MSFPYDSLSAAYSGVTDSDPEPRKPYLIAYKYDRRKIRDKGRFRATGSISEPERGRNLTGFNPIPKVMHPETRYHLPAQYLKPRNKYPVNFRTFPREGCFQPLKNTFDVPPVRDAAHRDILEEELQIKDSSEEAKSKEDIQMEDLSEENDVEEVPMLKKDEPAPPRHPCEGLTVV
ncbi:putative Down syndrome cell adhesion molecule-like [Apostichopus japonicus]|uniref:Putative Down syndrome cell adhesion molecule-like n=1 Tax=Stichopus japonicus TaxID=307972 RepID=A0A2G8L2Z5_STIJA|nr:putative Down syndrome cell adhesion molecule-like [Apostichopus japonicus]